MTSIEGSDAPEPIVYSANDRSTSAGAIPSYLFQGERQVDRVYVGEDKVFPPAQWWYHGRLTLGGVGGATGIDNLVFSPDGTKVYCGSNSTSLTTRDVSTRAVLNNQTLPAGSRARGVDVSPDGKRLYVAEWGLKKVTVMDTETYVMSDLCSLTVGPNTVIVHPDGSRLYAVDSNGPLSVVDTTSGSVITTIATGGPQFPNGIAISPDGRTLCVVVVSSKKVAIIDTASNTIRSSVSMVHTPGGLSISPDGKSLYVADMSTGPPDSGVSVVSLETDAIIGRARTEKWINDVVVSPEGRYLYASHTARPAAVEIVDLSSGLSRHTVSTPGDAISPLDTVPTPDYAQCIALSRDGRTLCVSASLSVIRADYPGIGVAP